MTEVDLFCSYCNLLYGSSACLYKRLKQWTDVCVCVFVCVRTRVHMQERVRERQ